jgi:hypothetical protein
MIPSRLKKFLDLAPRIGVLLLVFGPSIVCAQVSPEMRRPLSIHVFGGYTYGSSDWSTNHSSGITLGGFVQSQHLWGLEARGSYLHWGTEERRYDAVFGPRVALHLGRFSPYGTVLVGVAHPITWTNGINTSFRNGNGVEWKLLGGVDFYAGHGLSIRLGEVSYARVYALQGLSPVDFGAGLVYRFPISKH